MDNLKDYEVETDLLEESLLNVCELKGIAEISSILCNEMSTFTDRKKTNYQDIFHMISQSIKRISNELDEKLERILYMRAK